MADSRVPPPGALREYVNILRRVVTPDGVGGSSSTWKTIFSDIPAQITPAMRGTQLVIAQGLQPTAFYNIFVRSSSETQTILESDAVYDQKTENSFQIKMITNPDERYRFLQILCERGVALG